MKFLRAATIMALFLQQEDFKETLQKLYDAEETQRLWSETVNKASLNGEWGEENEILAISIAIDRPIYQYTTCRTSGIMNENEVTDFETLQEVHRKSKETFAPGMFQVFASDNIRMKRRQPIGIFNNENLSHYTAMLPRNHNSRYFEPNVYFPGSI